MTGDLDGAEAQARAGGRWLLARRAVALLLTLGSTLTIARLVSPRDYGLANMAALLFAFAQYFRDFGVTNAVLRKGRIEPGELSLIFWFNAATTTAIVVALGVAAPAAARFWREPVVAQVIWWSLPGFWANGITMQHRAVMSRSLRFGAIALIDVAALVAGFAVTLLVALLRHDLWAIVWGQLAQYGVSAALYAPASGFRPGPPRSDPAFLDLLRFGANSSLFSLSAFLGNNIGPLLIGQMLGPAPLGLFNRAQALQALPSNNLVQPMTQTALPLLTRLRPDAARYRAAYLALVARVSMLLLPLSVILALAGVPLAEAALGSRWHGAGLVLVALAPALWGTGVGQAAADIFITQNRPRALRNIGLAELAMRGGAVAAAVPWGPTGIAWAFSAATIAGALLRATAAGQDGVLGLGDHLRACRPSLPAALGAGLLCLAAGTALRIISLPPAAVAALLCAAGAVGALAAAMAMPRSRHVAADLADHLLGIRLAHAAKGTLDT